MFRVSIRCRAEQNKLNQIHIQTSSHSKQQYDILTLCKDLKYLFLSYSENCIDRARFAENIVFYNLLLCHNQKLIVEDELESYYFY